MKQNQIKFKNLKEDQTIQVVDLNDYFGDAVPTISKPLTKKEFVEELLQEIIDDNDGEVSVDEAFELMAENDGGDSNKVYITVIDGVAQVVLP